jgi:catechol 2,3-dioxygenase-like lactoylglutathione lyase family enzyme
MRLVEAVRRVTITTNDMEASLRFYRDALGMSVWYDGDIHDAIVNQLFGLQPTTVTRVLILHSEQSYIAGMVGLMEFKGQEIAPRPTTAAPTPHAGEVIVMMTTTRINALYQRLMECGCEIIAPPTRLQIPGREVVYEMLVRDPNGVRVTFAQNGELD